MVIRWFLPCDRNPGFFGVVFPRSVRDMLKLKGLEEDSVRNSIDMIRGLVFKQLVISSFRNIPKSNWCKYGNMNQVIVPGCGQCWGVTQSVDVFINIIVV